MGKCTPIISDRWYSHLLPDYDQLSSAWAKDIDYPLGDSFSLTRLAQYLSITIGDSSAKEEFLTFIKAYYIAKKLGKTSDQVVSEHGQRLIDIPLSSVITRMGYGTESSNGVEPLQLIAQLPSPIYLTTSYFNFIELALQKQHRQPQAELCIWNDNIRGVSDDSINSLPSLHYLIAQSFNSDELQDLCLRLGEEYENIPGTGRAAKARELVLYMQRRQRLPALVELAKQFRPTLKWPDLLLSSPMDSGIADAWKSVFRENSSYRPTPENPLVYHLYGVETYPRLMVLSEDNHLDFLIRISQERRLIPPIIAQALEDSSLLLLGYRIHDWDFRTIFRGLISSRRGVRREVSIAIQLEPEAYTSEAQKYLEHYFREVEFKVFWGTPFDFIAELTKYLN